MPSPWRSGRSGQTWFLRQLHRPQVGEEAELLAQPQQGRAFGAFFLGNRRVAIRQTDRAKQDGVGFFAERERGLRQGLAGRVNARPADGGFGKFQRETKFLFGGAQNLDGFTHDFGADAVAGEDCDVETFHKIFPAPVKRERRC